MLYIEVLYFDNIESFTDEISNYYHENNCPSTTVIVYYDEAIELIELLVQSGYDIYKIDITNPEINGYTKEYVVTLDDLGVWCEPMWRDINQHQKSGYINHDTQVCYIHKDCCSIILNKINSEKIYTFSL